MIDLQNKTAVVTGSGSGIGRAIALRLAACGATVAVADLNLDGAKETVTAIETAGGTAGAFEVDVTDVDSVRRLRDDIRLAHGTTSIIVNNAGWNAGMPFLTTEPDFWRRVIDINYAGVLAMCHVFVSDLVDEGVSGHVVNVASDAGRVGSMGEAVYAGAKGGVVAFSKSLAREMARYGINVNAVSPGPTDTPLFHDQPEKIQAALIRAIPFRRLADPDEIASAVTYLASDQASYVTGQVLSVSGGLTMVD
jgi:2-hydroxycyclohexanecarboxyl-CoA dehydrogenase